VSMSVVNSMPDVNSRPARGSLSALMAWLVVGLATAALVLIPLALPGYAQILEGGAVKGQFGDWQVVCRPPPPGSKNEICGAVQSVTAEDNQNVGLTVMVQKYSNGETIMRVVTSLGVILGKGLGVQIDDSKEGAIPFDRCLPVGCQAQFLLDGTYLGKLKGKKTLLFIIYRTREAGLGIPISLAGFEQAVGTLK
jgi:invasion protein IalB